MAAEKSFENKIKKYLESRGCWFVKYFANRMTKSGVPDILACVNGRFVGIEVKATNGHPSDLQLWNRDKIRDAGGIAIIIYPEQWDDFVDLINELVVDPNDVDRECVFETFDERRKKSDNAS